MQAAPAGPAGDSHCQSARPDHLMSESSRITSTAPGSSGGGFLSWETPPVRSCRIAPAPFLHRSLPMSSLSRREFLTRSAALAGGVAVLPRLSAAPVKDAVYSISLAQWSLQQGVLRPRQGREARPAQVRRDRQEGLRHRRHRVRQPVLQGQEEGRRVPEGPEEGGRRQRREERPHHVRRRGEPRRPGREEAARQAVENHQRWVEWAKFLGCHSIRVNAASDWQKGFEETQKLRRRRAAQAERVRRHARHQRDRREPRRAVEPTARGWPG